MGKKPDDVLRGIFQHLVYEVQMFGETARVLSKRGATSDPSDEERVIVNALLESFIIHARSLLHFLYAVKPHKDDVIAEHFFDDPGVWHQQRPVMSKLLQGVRERVNKEVAHLTYSRIPITAEERKWRFVDITTDLLQIFKKFSGLLPTDLMNPSQT